MKKVDKVFAVFPVYEKMSQLLFERADTQFWTLLGGSVRDAEEERDALMRHLCEEWLPSEVDIHAQLGPLYVFPDGTTAKAYLCTIDDPSGTPAGEMVGQYTMSRFFDARDVDASIAVDPGPIERIVWDAFSIMDEPVILRKQADVDDETVYCDPGVDHLLVQEGEDARRVWRRLDPSSPTRYMEPSS